jgi:hypothetical protein
VTSGGAPSQAMLNVIESHSSYSLYVYPDSLGNPTIGCGLNLNAANAQALLSQAGLDYSSIIASWTSTQSLWTRQGHKLSILKDTSPKWKAFVAANPSVTTPVITDSQAQALLSAQTSAWISTAAGYFGSQFYSLDRDPQIAVVDFTAAVPSLAGSKAAAKLATYISAAATDYTKASQSISITGNAKARQADDRKLLLDGEFPTEFTVSSLTLKKGTSGNLVITTTNAFGKAIVLSTKKYSLVSSQPGVASVTKVGHVKGKADGVSTIIDSLTDAPSIQASGTVTVQSTPKNPKPTKHTFTISQDGTPNPLTGAQPGDVITLQAFFTTTDPNEDGEGEDLGISSSGGFSVVDSTYNATTTYTFVCTQANESISVDTSSFDGDESGNVTATDSSTADPSFTSPEINAFSTAAQGLDTTAAGIGTVAGLLDSTFASYSAGISNAAWVDTALLSLASTDFANLAVGTDDESYASIAKPARSTTAIFSHAKDFKGIKNAGPLAAAINALEINEEKSLNLAVAAATTANRVSGATDAGDDKSTAKQLKVLASYKKQESALLAAQTVLAQKETVQLDKAGLGSTAAASSDVSNFESNIFASVPTQLTTALNKLKVAASIQSQIQQALFVQDTNAASGTYDSILTSSTLQSELRQLSQLLAAG